MTIIEAITQADALNRNAYHQKQKIIWLSRVEALIKQTVVDIHEGGEGIQFSGFDEHTNLETELIMPQPYDEGYIHWLQAQVYYANDEIDRYNRAMSMFNACLDSFKTFYKKGHAPKGSGRFRF